MRRHGSMPSGSATGPRTSFPATNSVLGRPVPIALAPAASTQQRSLRPSPANLPRSLTAEPIPQQQQLTPSMSMSYETPQVSSQTDGSFSYSGTGTGVDIPQITPQQASTPAEDFNVQGHLQVALARIRSLETEVSDLKMEIMLKETEQQYHNRIDKGLQAVEDTRDFQEREVKEEQDLLTRSRTLALALAEINSSQGSQNAAQEKMEIEEGRDDRFKKAKSETDKGLAEFLDMARTELVVLMRHQARRNEDFESSKAEGVKEVTKQTSARPEFSLHGSPLLQSSTSPPIRSRSPEPKRLQFSPSSPLSRGPTSPTPRESPFFSGDTLTLDNALLLMPDCDLTTRVTELDLGCEAAAALIRAIGRIVSGKHSVVELVQPLRVFLLPDSQHSPEVMLCAIRILYYAATQFRQFRVSVLEDQQLIDSLILRLDPDDSSNILEVPILRFFLALTRGKIHGKDPVSLKALRPLLAPSGAVARRIHLKDATVSQGCASDLLGLLWQKGSDALPDGFPAQDTWDKVISPFGYGGSNGVICCIAFVAQYGDDGMHFLLHHGLLADLIDVMYSAEVSGKPDRLALSLLASVLRVKPAELNDDEKHRLIASLLSLREVRGGVDTAQVVAKAEMILKALSCL